MKNTLIFLFVAFQLNAFGQEKILLQDNFDTNANKWKLRRDSNFNVNIGNGVLHIEKFEKNRIKNGCLWYYKEIPGLNTLNNFSMTIHARFISGGDIFDMFDLMWGKQARSASGNIISGLYKLSFLTRAEVHLDYFHIKWTYFIRKNIKEILPPKFNPAEFNKYELIQQDGYVVLKLNDQEVFRHLTDPIPGNSIGFQQCLKSAWEIDKIIIKQDEQTQKLIVQASKPIADTSAKQQEQTNKKTSHEPIADSVSLSANTATPVAAKTNFKVFPNPFEHNLNASFYLDKEQTVIISLIDMKGSILQQHTKKLQKGAQTIRLYADIFTGTYLLKIQLGNGETLSSTVIKQ